MRSRISLSTADRFNKVRTTVLAFIMSIIILFIFYDSLYIGGGLLIFFALMYVYVYGNLPTRFLISDDRIVLDAPFKKRIIRLDDIIAVRLLENEDIKGLVRAWGSSGIFGEWGYYYSSRIGSVKVYARRSKNWILITTSKNGKYIIAPDDPEFINYIKE